MSNNNMKTFMLDSRAQSVRNVPETLWSQTGHFDQEVYSQVAADQVGQSGRKLER